MTIKRTRRSIGGATPAEKSALGRSLSVRPGRSPGTEAATGTTLAVRPGRSPGEDAAKGYALAARKFSEGGSLKKFGGQLDKAGYLEKEAPNGLTRMAINIERNQDLNAPHFKKGGHAHKKVYKQLHGMYKTLHRHFGGETNAEHEARETPSQETAENGLKRKSGGKMWIKGAIKHPGALHKSLRVPKGQKIPIAKIHKAEHSSNPTLRKRAKLAETLKGFHRPKGR